jgi:hypothetical protein
LKEVRHDHEKSCGPVILDSLAAILLYGVYFCRK